MRTRIALALLAAVLAAVGLIIQAARRGRESARATETLELQDAELAARISSAESKLHATRDANVALEREIAAANEQAPQSPVPSTRPLSPLAQIANDSVKMAAYGRDFRSSLDLAYGGLKNIPGFSAELFEKIKDLKTSVEQRRLDTLATAEMQGLDLNGPAARELGREAAAQLAKREAELLGPLLDSYHEFVHTQPLRDAVRRLGSCEMYPDKPLTSAEIEQVVGILAQHAKRGKDGTVLAATINLQGATPELQRILSPAALDMLRWAPPGGIEDAVISRTATLIAPLNASLPPEKRRGPWALYSDMSTGPR